MFNIFINIIIIQSLPTDPKDVNAFRDLEGYVSYTTDASDSYGTSHTPEYAVYKPDFLPFSPWSSSVYYPQEGQPWTQVIVE